MGPAVPRGASSSEYSILTASEYHPLDPRGRELADHDFEDGHIAEGEQRLGYRHREGLQASAPTPGENHGNHVFPLAQRRNGGEFSPET